MHDPFYLYNTSSCTPKYNQTLKPIGSDATKPILLLQPLAAIQTETIFTLCPQLPPVTAYHSYCDSMKWVATSFVFLWFLSVCYSLSYSIVSIFSPVN